MLMQAEAQSLRRNVTDYEGLVPDAACALPRAGLGSKLAHMYNRKSGALSKVIMC